MTLRKPVFLNSRSELNKTVFIRDPHIKKPLIRVVHKLEKKFYKENSLNKNYVKIHSNKENGNFSSDILQHIFRLFKKNKYFIYQNIKEKKTKSLEKIQKKREIYETNNDFDEFIPIKMKEYIIDKFLVEIKLFEGIINFGKHFNFEKNVNLFIIKIKLKKINKKTLIINKYL